MEPGRATPREDRWKMQVRAFYGAVDAEIARAMLLHGAPFAGGFIPRARPILPGRSGARSPPPTLRATDAAPSSGSQRNRMTLFLNPAMHYSIFHTFPPEMPRDSDIRIACMRLASRLPHYNTIYVSRAIYDKYLGNKR